MGFIVPNDTGGISSSDQAEPDAQDFSVLGDRSTGVVTGCVVAAQTPAAMSVQVAAGSVVVGGVPVTVTSGNVTIQTAGASPRFDLIVVDATGLKKAIKGTASASNPVFPTVDPTQNCLLAAVYVAGSITSIASAAIVDKRIQMERSLRRGYTANTDVVVGASAPAGQFTVQADGEVKWGENALRRTGAQAMEWVTSVVLKAVDSASSVLTLRSRSVNPDTQKVLDVQAAGGTSLASISGTGVLQAANFLRGSGSPEGVVTAEAGSLYIDVAAPRNAALWMKSGSSSSSSGWEPFRVYDPSDDAVPIGTMAPFIGLAEAVPAGWILLDGRMISTTDDATKELAEIIGSTYGSGTGTVAVPDFRGRIPIGTGGGPALVLGQEAGTMAVSLQPGNLAAHSHPVTDPGHRHPSAGREVFYTPAGPWHPDTDDAPWAINFDVLDSDTTATTGITVGESGSGEPFSVLNPVTAVNWMVKARTVGRQANADGSNGLWSIGDLDVRYAPLAAGLSGTGFPEGVVTAPVGTVYRDTAATNGAVLWVKATGSGNTGWRVAYGNTGARLVTTSLPWASAFNTSEMRVRRDGAIVYARFNLVRTGGLTTHINIFDGTASFTGSMPAGFQPHAPTMHGSTMVLAGRSNSSGALFQTYIHMQSNPEAMMWPGGVATNLTVNASWMTNDAWPATLPGSAV
jgi:microcystin-dependent protein